MAAQYFFFQTAGTNNFFFQTAAPRFYFRTSDPFDFFFQTPEGGKYNFRTSTPNNFFFRTSKGERTTDLILKPSYNDPGSIAADFSSVTIVDATGTYPTDQTGYNPQGDATDPLRAKRSEVQLWIVLQDYTDDPQSPVLIAPDTQNNVTPNFTYIFDTEGDRVYNVVMIGAPLAEDWNNWKTRVDLVEYAAANWFVGSVGLAKIPNATNAFADLRYNMVKGLLISKPRPRNITELDSRISGLMASIQVQNWDRASTVLADINNFVEKLPRNQQWDM
jgi:hypothetical protein